MGSLTELWGRKSRTAFSGAGSARTRTTTRSFLSSRGHPNGASRRTRDLAVSFVTGACPERSRMGVRLFGFGCSLHVLSEVEGSRVGLGPITRSRPERSEGYAVRRSIVNFTHPLPRTVLTLISTASDGKNLDFVQRVGVPRKRRSTIASQLRGPELRSLAPLTRKGGAER